MTGRPVGVNRKSILRRLIDYPAPTPQSTPCCLWQGPVNNERGGYGLRSDGKMMHRWVWEQIHGPLRPGRCVLHRCDNPPCYRYEHLFEGTRADNNADKCAKGRGRSAERSAKLSGELNGNVKLTAEQVNEIRMRVAAGEKQVHVAKEFGVSFPTVSKIVLGQRWAHTS